MAWSWANAHVIGTSHQQNGLPCQDYIQIRRLEAQGGDILVAALCDGAGSAKCSDLGARSVAAFMVDAVVDPGNVIDLSRGDFQQWLSDCQKHLAEIAAGNEIQVHDLACTLLFAILAPSFCIFAQVGDGCWVVERRGVLAAATWPDEGEMAGQTEFVTSSSALDSFQFLALTAVPDAVAGFTDGIQRLCLDMARGVPHGGFFRPVFGRLMSPGPSEDLNESLAAFLSSEKVNARTDDDKSLFAARRFNPQGATV